MNKTRIPTASYGVFYPSWNKDFYTYKAGQYLNIRVKINGKNHDRCFSLSSSPLDNYLRITVKLNGVVSHWFKIKAKVGDTIDTLLPVGDFVLIPEKEYLFVGGG